MYKIADFLGITILGYTLMGNHYHQVVAVPGLIELTNEDLLERIRLYYSEKSSEYRKFKAAMERGDGSADLLRPAYIRYMGDLSEFQKRLKQGFSTWYNKQRGRKGTLWMERFGSTITEDHPEAAMAMMGYVDLNAVRAGMVDDPKDYPYCGYSAALAGSLRCRAGIMRITQTPVWEEAAQRYRLFLIQKGGQEVAGKVGKVSREVLLRTLAQKGHLSVQELLRLRVRHFTHGLAVGSALFVESLFQQHRMHFGQRRKSGARPIDALSGLELCSLRNYIKAGLS
jgi:hypothetical protein